MINNLIFRSTFMLLFLNSITFAQAAPTSFTAQQLATIKSGIYDGCVTEGIKRGEKKNYVEKFCKCSSQVLEKTMTDKEFFSFITLPKTKETLAKHPKMQETLAKLGECRKK